MARKRWEAQTEITPELLRAREKRKWQIALRRYVVERNPSTFYAPYFGLDVETMRKWFEYQFTAGVGWDDFGKKWQLDHLVPLACFDFAVETDLKMCWNFVNLRATALVGGKEPGGRIDMYGAKTHFQRLFSVSGYQVCLDLIQRLENLEEVGGEALAQEAFFKDHADHISKIQHYSTSEFELLNRGRTPEEVQKEMDFLKNL